MRYSIFEEADLFRFFCFIRVLLYSLVKLGLNFTQITVGWY